MEEEIFSRAELLLGPDSMEKIRQSRVILFGVGGVGSWCAESLIRSGIRKLTIVDSDRICITNINRQLPATVSSIGKVKVNVLRSRLLEINPYAEINALQQVYCSETSESFQLPAYDFIIDAIDSLENKVHLIREATKTNAVFFSSMGAALKTDASKIRTAEFWKVKGCPLGAALRRKMRKEEGPSKKFLCVYSEEVLKNKGTGSPCISKNCSCSSQNKEQLPLSHDWHLQKKQINGTLAHITAIFGFTLAGLVIESIQNSLKI
jgi:Dinucleotide-utilizing enzymes involved in molybdopterin and thiamine biosynthesis family 1